MANIIKPKRSNTASAVPTTGQLASGELAVNMADKKVYINNGTAVVQVGAGNLSALGDANISAPSNGQSLTYDTASGKWVNTSAGTGTVTSVGMTVPTGLSVSGSPVTNSGTLAVELTAGYSIPTTASQTNWNTAYSDRLKWDGGSTGLTASTGRTSLGGSTVGQNFFTLTNPTSVTFPRINADNTVSALDATTFRTAIGAGTSSTTGTVTSVTGGSYLTGGTITSSGTLAVDATSANTASKVVARDASGNFSAGTITATLSGNASTATTASACSGNAATATALQTARTINGVSFNGSANITVTANTTNTLTLGSYLTGSNFNGSAATTWAVDATSANTASKVVARDASGNFSAGTITAALSGNATTATTAASCSGNAATATTASGVSAGVVSGKTIYDNFTATASQTTFTTSVAYTSGKIEVFANGVKMVNAEDVTVTSGTQVVFASGLAVNTKVTLVYPI